MRETARSRGGVFPLVALASLLPIAWLVVKTAPTPAPADEASPPAEFSAQRARRDIAALVAEGPRPVRPRGELEEPAHAHARERLFARMRELGLKLEAQEGEGCRRDGTCYPLTNLIGRLDPLEPEAKSRGAVVLLSHYDSVAAGPGAGDAASGTAVALEIARALRDAATLRRPLLVIIDDGEEAGLLGARLFLRHPAAAQALAVLNFEARGTAGQAAMFETSDRSAWLVEDYGRAAAHPVASSVIYSLYKMLPNDTDLTVTKAAGLYGLNFAFADADWNYHTRRDDLAHLDLRSVQHMGDEGLAAARALVEKADLPGLPPVDTEAIYFDLFSRRLLVYRVGAAKALAAALFLFYAAAIAIVFFRRRGAAVRGLFSGLLRFFLPIFVAVPLGQVIPKVIAAIARSPRPWREAPLPTFMALFAAAVAVGCGVDLLWDRLLGKQDRPDGDRASGVEADAGRVLGSLLPLVVAALALTFVVVGASYPFTLPALAMAAPLCLVLHGVDRVPWLATPRALSVALYPGLLAMAVLWFPLLRVIRVMIGAQLPIAITLPVALCLPYFLAQVRLVGARTRLGLSLLFAVAAGFAIVIAIR
jgi:hypothetical protein